MRLGPLVLGTVLTASTGASAWAQQQPQVPAVAGAREIKLGVRVSGYHETNIAKASAATAAARGVDRKDEYLRPLITGSVAQPLGQQVFFIQGGAGYDFYRRNSQLDRQRYDVTGGGAGRLGPCQSSAFGQARQQQSDLMDLDAGTTENRQRTTGVGVTMQCGRATGLQGGVILQQTQSKNSAATRRVSDADNRAVVATLSYVQPTLGTLSLIYNYSDSQFPNRIIPTRPVGDGFFTETFGVGLERDFSTRLTVLANVARTELKREFAPPGLRQKFTATTYSAGVSYRPGDRIELAANARRDVRPSERTGKLYDISTVVDGLARYNFGTRFRVSVGHSYSDVNSNVDTSQNANVITSAKTHATTAAVQYRQSERASLIFDVRREDRKTNLPTFNYKNTRFGITAEYNFF